MNPQHLATITTELTIAPHQVEAVAALFADGATVPFIARYRKEVTGSLDEVQITAVRDRLGQLAELDSRREAILAGLEKNGHLTDELKERVLAAETMAVLEDIYLPYRPKRRTKATIAREKGLEPLALVLLAQEGADPPEAALPFVDVEKGVASGEEALEGARHIIAEIVNEDETARSRLRALFAQKATVRSAVVAGKEAEGAKFKDYFDWQEPAATVPSHRLLAMRRGEREDVLSLTLLPDEDEALPLLESLFLKGQGPDSAQVRIAVHDSYKRLLSRSLETELRVTLKERADAEAIRVFAKNLRELLLAPPLGAKRVMGIDPGFRTGCKVVCLDRQGKLLHHDTVYPHTGEGQADKARHTLRQLCTRFEIEAIAIGNGTAGRETEHFVRGLGLDPSVMVLLVNESGASIYSASEVARSEFPDHDLTVRGAVSIGRRLMDPLAELVKIDPKSIGVGQYQHDVDQTALKAGLDDVVMSCVNGVGVDLNRASAQLLTYVSGLGPQLARNIVAHRDANGPFATRRALQKVPRLGPKAFEQAAGFLRIPGAANPLDASAVHPESYAIVDAMAADLGCTVQALMEQPELRQRIDIQCYVTDTVGLPTLTDIMAELAKPGRDPRRTFEAFAFADHVSEIKDLEPGMRLPGIVTNVTKFGAFVDLGVHQDGLVHISELADRFVKDPSEVVKVQQKVTVTVLEVDLERKRISLSMRTGAKPGASADAASRKDQPARKSGPASRKPGGSGKPQRPGRPEKQPFNNPFAALERLGDKK
ncbi:Tex family protein [Desulfatitalea alkaliphila]|uniref:RNA-binding transcriptional accessory protein n=1 Tax=Desulfatitalea alkaliphila TaxID=2929485 RepID=A0AA41R4W0_9BACT|nr:Tex family protein [Desulfatitalea alkaliphila]MCJ8501741.1 RNA-binding transcriptional accessory protein [Desulfatitalea alkaliphila]